MVKLDGVEPIKTTSAEYQWIWTLAASINTLDVVREKLEKRIEALGADEDVEKYIQFSKELLEGILMTVPESKRETCKRQIPHLFWFVNMVRPVVLPKSQTVLKVDDLDTIITAAHEQCLLCDHANRCNSCRLGKAFDETMPRDRKRNESWADIDFDEVE